MNIRPVRLDMAAQQDYLYRGSVTIQPRLPNYQITESQITVPNGGLDATYYGYGSSKESISSSEQTLRYGSYQLPNYQKSFHSSE